MIFRPVAAVAALLVLCASVGACGWQAPSAAPRHIVSRPSSSTAATAPPDWQPVALAAAEQAALDERLSLSRRGRVGRSARSTRVGGDIWMALARCESNGNPRARSANGRYHGAFQFTLSTWRSLGYSGSPVDHSFAVQLEAAQRLVARSGWAQFPRCARILGLR